MRALPGIWLIALFSALPAARADRVARDRVAREKILETHFFAEGGGMHLSPGLLDFADKLVPKDWRRKKMREEWGLNLRPDGSEIGIYQVPFGKMKVGVLGCVGCHSGRAAGQFIVGLGNKNVDTGAIGEATLKAERIWENVGKVRREGPEYREVEETAMAFAGELANPAHANLTQGMVPTAVIRTWFYRAAAKPLPAEMPRSAVKVPSLWGYGEKRAEGQFCDGLGDGRLAGWGAAVELVAHQRPEVVRAYMPKMEEAEQLLGDLLPPPYPGKIDGARAGSGRESFNRRCAGCHGTYESDERGLPVYKPPRYVPWETVRTDRDRLDGTTEEFLELIRVNPLNDFIRANPHRGKGYFAPRLHAVWSRFPYLHNASVPTVAALLRPAAERPRFFSLRDAGEASRFDPDALGLTLPKAGSREERALGREARRGARDVYFVERPGHGNQGHEFHTDMSDAERRDVIEYLKTL
jgi:mono/diheme cytochrome c family protein